MRKPTRPCAILGFLLVLVGPSLASGQGKAAVAAIRAADMKFDMQLLGAPEFRGRNMPSAELEIASRYIAQTAQRLGLRPLMPGGSYYQELPLEISRVSEAASRITVRGAGATLVLRTPVAFGVRGRTAAPGAASGGLVFLGLGISAPAAGWDDFAGLDVKGKVLVLLDAQVPASHVLRQPDNRAALAARATVARQKGAVAVLTVIPREREAMLAKNGLNLLAADRARVLDVETGIPGAAPVQPSPVTFAIDLRHDAAAALLGVSRTDLDRMFDRLAEGQRVASRELPGREADIAIGMEVRKGVSRNVVAWIEGTDLSLRGEYVVLGSHHDGIGYREDAVFSGADDNISGVVAMFSLARALAVERPKRSVIFVWHTGEEKGLLGAYYFVQHSPVPVEKITANLNMDMLCRNDPNSIYLIGSNKVSTELDKAINDANNRFTKLKLDYTYQEPSHPDRFFFRSDQYPYIRYGIPGVWFFCGTTADYHQPTDTEDRADYAKLERVTRLVYYVLMDIGSRPAMLKLDVDPRIATRGAGNMKIDWTAQRTGTAPD